MTDKELLTQALEEQPACPYIRSSKEGTHWCALAEQPAIVTRAEEAFAAAQERGWVGLTDDDIDLLVLKHAPPIHPDFTEDDDFIDLARAIEAKLREKNPTP